MRIGDFLTIKLGRKDPDFWIQTRGSEKNIGKVLTGDTTGKGRQVKVKYHYGAKVKDKWPKTFVTTLLDRARRRGRFKPYAYGSLPLAHIRKRDIENIQVGDLALDTSRQVKRRPKLFQELQSMIGWRK
jgi:hypothetical protein